MESAMWKRELRVISKRGGIGSRKADWKRGGRAKKGEGFQRDRNKRRACRGAQ